MAKKKSTKLDKDMIVENVEIANAGIMEQTSITKTLKQNYMPYAMSVIVSRALPEIDGFKPSHRKLLYTMYLMGLLTGARTKSANVVGQTMKLNPHGDGPIYDTMVRLSRGNESLLHPYVDSKGNFGKSYSRDMAYAASRYTEVKLANLSAQLFSDIQKNTVDFIDNYDGTMKEPTLLPVTYPSILVNSNIGIAVGMASSISPFNLAEVCETTVALIKDKDHDIMSTLKAPDFPGGGYIIYDQDNLNTIYETGRGSVKVRSKYKYEKAENCIEITEIPPSTTIEAIMDKIAEQVKNGKIKELSDMRDESDIKGLRITLDLKRATDPEKLMQKLFKLTPLEDSFSCNFTVLIDGAPMLVGVRDILSHWIVFRRNCVKRRTAFDLAVKKDRLHILKGLSKILLDIDKAIKIVRETDEEGEVVPNLMIGFGIDEIQANYIAEIKLRNLNKEYILKRLEEIKKLEDEIAELSEILASEKLIDKIIIKELAEVAKKHAQPRKTRLLFNAEYYVEEEKEEISDHPVHIFYTREGYFKKITPQSLRMSSEQKLKDGDEIVDAISCKNDTNLIFFTNQRNAYKARPADFDDSKASVIGDFVAGTLSMQEGELPIAMLQFDSYEGNVLFFMDNGKVAKVPLSAYETKLNRKKLQNGYSKTGELLKACIIKQDAEFAIFSSTGRMLLLNSVQVPQKLTKDTVGVAVLTLKKGAFIEKIVDAKTIEFEQKHRFRAKNLPAAGGIIKETDLFEQIELI